MLVGKLLANDPFKAVIFPGTPRRIEARRERSSFQSNGRLFRRGTGLPGYGQLRARDIYDVDA